jgi:hypothetical protein
MLVWKAGKSQLSILALTAAEAPLPREPGFSDAALRQSEGLRCPIPAVVRRLGRQ